MRRDALTKREELGERSREEILDVAERLMSRKGYSATSISDLAKESGLPASSIYWHFGSKSGLLGHVMERGAHRFFEDTRKQFVLSGRSPRKRLGKVFAISADAIDAHPRFLRLFMLLLLGSAGDHTQDALVARVRAEGKKQLAAAVRLAFEPWGEALADHVADELAEMAIVLFDGSFIASQTADAKQRARTLDQTVAALWHLACGVRASKSKMNPLPRRATRSRRA